MDPRQLEVSQLCRAMLVYANTAAICPEQVPAEFVLGYLSALDTFAPWIQCLEYVAWQDPYPYLALREIDHSMARNANYCYCRNRGRIGRDCPFR